MVFLGILSTFVIVVGVVWFIILFFKHQPTEKPIILTGIALFVFCMAIILTPSSTKNSSVSTQNSAQSVKRETPNQNRAEQKKATQSTATKSAPNYKYIFKQDLPRITGAKCVIDMNTLEMDRMGEDFVIFHCTALLNGNTSKIEALYYASSGKLIQMKRDGKVIFHDAGN